MIHLSQRDPRWSSIYLKPSKLTMGRFGCTTTCICMLADYFKCYKEPEQAIDVNIKYTADGLIIWEKIDFPKFKCEKRIRAFSPGQIDISLKDPDKAVILEVANKSHWVVALRKIIGTQHYFILDPWDGKVKTTYAYKNITGSAHFIKK